MMAIMLGGAQFLRWSGLWNLCTEQFVRNVLSRKYLCGNNTEKRRLKKLIKNGLRTTIEIILQKREDWKKLIQNGFRTTIEIILQRRREYWKNDQKWFKNDIWNHTAVKRRLKKWSKIVWERQLRLWSKSKSPCHDNNCIFWCEMMLNEARDVLCREKKFTYEQNGRKWFDDKIVPSSFLTQMKKHFL